ncbi:iron ABC transporter permease [Bacillus inaquosorum]|uniref:FecCD family ABC transporter permease n=1 Tax=Bacillus inaquosorum TaxID=483913 RepID=UPI00228029E1|nr:iron ABC transporter permease [Bacillus inaquosorum]MCY8072319.1 iron ABC transporter permease [Bacillus inaquosorum]MCY8236266.1 iron ABC transporter permease [Bacillus inaquosorum]MCY9060861.1 iron ABC transporter permease [Bacillus inaquosorum]MCY9076262.1 iron ABC transporter permease [Bacillus inaquosorum]MCY9377650.1 iron ABC transporter permease [Bacillus inaquosorum]
MKTKTKKPLVVMAVTFMLIVLVFFISLNLGVIKIAPLKTLQVFFGQGTARDELVLFEFRLPRIILSLLVGAGIAVAGAILQSVSQNDLAEPGILGINAGGSLAVVLFIYFFQGSASDLSFFGTFMLPFSALAGAILAAFLIYLLAWKKGVTPIRLILVGIGVNAGFNALLLIFQLKMDPHDFMQAAVWISGSIWGANWNMIWAILPWIVILLPFTLYKARYLNILQLGDQLATGLGTAVERERRILLLAAVTLAASCVAAAGGIAFLGLIAPHVARRLTGPRHQTLIPVSAFIGAFLFLLADTLARNVLAPSEIPVGLVISVLGAPYFIYLLMKAN